jgi:hypothetical protein
LHVCASGGPGGADLRVFLRCGLTFWFPLPGSGRREVKQMHGHGVVGKKVPGERHQCCAYGSGWEALYRWREAFFAVFIRCCQTFCA